MSFTISKEFRFEAAHSLPHLHPKHKCFRLHGHSYVLVVHCQGPLDPELGWVIDYADIASKVDPIINRVDHRNLNDLITGPTTAENLAVWFHDQLKGELPLEAIEIQETASTSVVYKP